MWSQNERRFVHGIANDFVDSLPLHQFRRKSIYALVFSRLETVKPWKAWAHLNGKTFSPIASKKNTERPSCGGVHHSTNKFPKTPKASCWEGKRLCSQSKSQLKGVCKYQKTCQYILYVGVSGVQCQICLHSAIADSKCCRACAILFL